LVCFDKDFQCAAIRSRQVRELWVFDITGEHIVQPPVHGPVRPGIASKIAL
jgi:hypothetical protein